VPLRLFLSFRLSQVQRLLLLLLLLLQHLLACCICGLSTTPKFTG
jgi:hypothetical protein